MLNWISGIPKKEKVLLALFCFTCLQLVTKIPDITLIPGERTKVFSGLLCGITLSVLLVVRRGMLRLSPEWVMCIFLSLLCILSGFFSGTPFSSLCRGITLIFSAVGGFWCGRLLFNTEFSQRMFARFCLVLLTLLLLFGLAGFFLYGDVVYLADIHKHTFNGLILLLSFGPLAFLYGGKRWLVIIGVVYLLAGSYVISLSFDPMIWFPPLLLFGWMLISMKKKRYILIPILCVILLVSLFQKYKLPDHYYNKESISIWARVENIFFSYHMAKKRPLLGIGLVAPRIGYLDDYTIVYPYVTREKFSAVLPEENRSSENQFLTFMCDLGFPFLLMYSFSVAFLYLKLLKNIREHGRGGKRNAIVLWIPITGSLIHFQVYDSLLQPQICWFFHILLGMISANAAQSVGQTLHPGEKTEYS
ncbi:MAG: hypothetical protein V2B20_09325 [Pseudomonadota bacterium]